VLKSIWLDRKRNRRIDHLICILTRHMLPEHYEPRHRAQGIGFEGADLAEKHRHAVLESARNIPLDAIKSVNDTQDDTLFHVASQSNLGKSYLVDIQKMICDCPDFPRIRLCKHLCAVKIWYPFIFLQDSFIQDLQRSAQISPQSTSLPGELSHRTSISEPSALPNRDRLSPNQNLWAATVKKMGARTPPKRCQPARAAVLPSSTSQHIGPINAKRKLLFTDAYSGGEQSGKRAKVDAAGGRKTRLS
jgi:hypothetical protein